MTGFPEYLRAFVLATAGLYAATSARGGEPLPAPSGGTVTLVSGHTYTVTETNDLSAVTQISVVQGSTLEYDISSGQTLTVPCQVKGKGNVVKNGPGLVINSLSGTYDHYIENPGSIIINDGTLRGPSIPGQYSAYYLGRLVINSPGVYDSAYNGNTQVYGLWGDGTLTCTRSGGCNQLNIATDKGSSSETYHAPSQFTGLISGDTLRLVPNGYFDILSTNNTCNGAPVLNTGANIGLMSFGKSGQPASLGKPNFCSRGNEVKFRYLGTTGETVTKNFGCDIACGNYTLDAGTYGGLVLAGTINMRQLASGYATHTFIMTGDHSTPCSVTGSINETYTSSSKTYRGPIAFKKTGTGTWRMASGTKGDYCGLVSVENGTLEYVDVAPKGTNSSLGNATNTSTYAILLGSSSTAGTFKYVGTSRATVTDRPIALTGKGGRLVADSGKLEWTGISSASASTLYLAGDANTNYAHEVSGATSIVKEGSGTWVLDGENDFTGSLTANGGTLVVQGDVSEKNDFDFRWFKLVLRGQIGGMPNDHGLEFEEFAFYDENGVRQLDGFTFVKSYTSIPTTWVSIPDLSAIRAGEYGWLKAGTSGQYGCMKERDADKLFDDNNVHVGDSCGMAVANGVTPTVDKPETWFELLVRLPTGMTKITAFDLAGNANYSANREVTNWTLLGSEDGVAWETLKTYDDNGTHVGGNYWYSDRTAFAPGQVRKGKGYPTTVEDSGATAARLANVTKATVSTGATLRVVGKANFPLVDMAGGTLLVGAGTTNAYDLLIVSGVDSQMKIPAGTKVTIGDSTALTWPAEGRLYITTEGDGEVEFGGFTAQQKTQVYLNGFGLDELESERIAFLGDSITCGGCYEYFLQDFESSRHPGKNIRLLNCGISGDTTGGALKRLEADVFARKPTRVAIMFGMNDVGLSNYCENPTAAQKTAQADSLATFARNLTNLVDRITARDIDVTLVTPTPYDEYTASNETFVAATNYKTANEKGLTAIAQIVRDLANARGLTLIDLHAPMTEIYRTSETHFNRVDRVHPEEAGHALMSLVVWKQFGYGANPYSDQTINGGGGYVCTNYVPSGLPFASVDSLNTAKAAVAADYAAMNREIVRFAELPDTTYTLYVGGTSLGTYTAAELKSGIDLAQKATPSLAQSGTAWAKMKSWIGPDQKLRYFVMMEIQAQTYDPSVDVTDFAAVTNALEKWYATQTPSAYYRNLINLYENEKPNEPEIQYDVVSKWRELKELAAPQPYEIELKQQGLYIIPPNQGNVELSADTLQSVPAIYIGTNSCLVIKTGNTEATTIDITANICGPGDWFIWGSYVNIKGDNRGFTGRKTFTNAFVTVSSRYGLGSPSRELKNYVMDNTHGWYLHFAGNGLTNDVPVYAYGQYQPTWPATGFTTDYRLPLVMNGGFSSPNPWAFYMGNYVFAGGLYGKSSVWFESHSPCDIWLTGPLTVTAASTYLPVTYSARLHILAHPDSTSWQTWLYPLVGGTVICESENVWGESLALGKHNGVQSQSSGTLDMNGYDQTFKKVTFCYDKTSVQSSWTDLKLYVTSALPATLTMTTGSSNRQGIRFMGAAGLRFTGAGAWTNVLFRSETTGTLTVGDGTNAGEVFFDWGAHWGGDVVLNGGRFGCDTSKGLRYSTRVTIVNGGQLIIPDGVKLRVASVTVDGTALVKGTYQNVPWIKGGGSVQCGRVGFTMILRRPK